MKCSKTNLATASAVIILVAVIAVSLFGKKSSPYTLKALVLKDDPPQKPLKSLKYDVACTPGPSPQGAYYTKALTPGGFCGDQELVNAAMHGYTITSGVGGSLLDA